MRSILASMVLILVASSASAAEGTCKVKYSILPNGQIDVTCEQNTCTGKCPLVVQPLPGGGFGYLCPCS